MSCGIICLFCSSKLRGLCINRVDIHLHFSSEGQVQRLLPVLVVSEMLIFFVVFW